MNTLKLPVFSPANNGNVFVVRKEAAPGLDEVSTTGTLLPFPDRERDCRIHPFCLSDGVELCRCQAAVVAQRPEHRLRGADPGGQVSAVFDQARTTSTYFRSTL
jgi:hypothetical protein